MATKNELHLLAASLKVGLFASRETIPDALGYAYKVAQATDNPPAVLTALHVVLNTVASKLEALAAEPSADLDAYTAAAHAMQSSGSFASAIAEAYFRADSHNAATLRDAFKDLFEMHMTKETT